MRGMRFLALVFLVLSILYMAIIGAQEHTEQFNARYRQTEISHCNFNAMCYLCSPLNELVLGEG